MSSGARSPTLAPGRGAPHAPRGRPTGSVSLTEEVAETIVAYVRAGAFDHAAAEAAGVAVRTFYEWLARGEGRHPTRGSTPKLRAFARAVRRARAEARVAAEVRTYQERPQYWLSRAARSKPDREGWSDPRAGFEGAACTGGAGMGTWTDEDVAAGIDRLVAALVVEGRLRLPPCADPRCRCSHHGPGPGRRTGPVRAA